MHPAYPSGHSTQAFFIAYILGEKYPAKKQMYSHIANTISVNREYAGVHYKSDTSYGKIVAQNIYKHFSNKNNPLLL